MNEDKMTEMTQETISFIKEYSLLISETSKAYGVSFMWSAGFSLVILFVSIGAAVAAYLGFAGKNAITVTIASTSLVSVTYAVVRSYLSKRNEKSLVEKFRFQNADMLDIRKEFYRHHLFTYTASKRLNISRPTSRLASLSQIFLREKRKQSTYAILICASIILISAIVWLLKFSEHNIMPISIISLFYMFVVLSNDSLISYRIKKVISATRNQRFENY